MEMKSHFQRGKIQLAASPGQLNTIQFASLAEQESAELGRMGVWGLPDERVGEAQGKGPAKSSERKGEHGAGICASS